VIILSGVLVVLAIALLVTGIVTGNTGHEIAGLDGLKLIYVSIGVSIISALCLAVGVFVRRKELFGTATSQEPAKASAAVGRAGKAARPAKAKARVGAGDEAPVPAASATATEVPAETTVYIVPGRKRYHLETCRQLAGRDKEELTFVEAREEGFTACTACLPDTALAARAAITDAEPADHAPADSATVPAQREIPRPSADLTQATRTDLPTKKHEQVAAEPAAAADPVEVVEHAEAADHPEVAERPEDTDRTQAAEPVAEQPAERGASLFEPLDRLPAATAGERATAGDHSGDKDVTGDLSEPDDIAPGEPEHTTAEHASEAERSAEAEHVADAEPGQAADAEPEDTASAEPTEADAEATQATADAEVTQADADADADDADAEDANEARQGLAEQSVPTDEPESERDSVADERTDEEGGPADDAPADESATLSIVRILSGTKRYHRSDCALIEDIAEDADDLETLSAAEAKERGCTPCLVCQPDKDHPDAY
jgi:hypothetical protein